MRQVRAKSWRPFRCFCAVKECGDAWIMASSSVKECGARLFVRIRICLSDFCLCVCMQQGRHVAHKFESGWEVGVIKAFDKKGPHAGKFSVKFLPA